MTEMVKENGEVYVNSLITELLGSARKQDWNKVDSEIIPKISQLNDEDASLLSLNTTALLSGMIHRDWEDPDSRDAIVTALTAVNFPKHEILEVVTKRMLDLVEHDPKRFPSGRAAMFLNKFQEDGLLGAKIKEGLDKFKMRPEITEWKEELVKNIPGIERLLT